MTRRAAVLALALAAGVLSGCGGDGKQSGGGSLSWVKPPVRAPVSSLKPDDRVVGGEVRNDSLRQVELLAADLRLLDPSGKAVPAAVTFQTVPGHGLWPTGRINRQPLSEQLRLGMRRRLKPGEESALVVAWTEKPGTAAPVRIDYGKGSLPIDTE